jgi:hypothetical protein
LSALPTTQNPVSETVIDATARAMLAMAHDGARNAARAVNPNRMIPASGKSHLAQAIGYAVIQQG